MARSETGNQITGNYHVETLTSYSGISGNFERTDTVFANWKKML